LLIETHKALIVLIAIDAASGLAHDAHLNRMAQCKHAQLLELFQLLQRLRRSVRQTKEKKPAIGIQTKVLQKMWWLDRGIGLAVTHEWNRAAAEIQCLAPLVDNDFDAVGVMPLFQRANGYSESRHVGGQMGFQQICKEIERSGID